MRLSSMPYRCPNSFAHCFYPNAYNRGPYTVTNVPDGVPNNIPHKKPHKLPHKLPHNCTDNW